MMIQLGQHGRWCSILYVARALRLEHADLRTVVAHVRAQIAHGQFPAPASSRLRHGKPLTGAGAVSPKSEWLRAAVDAWIARQLTPEQRMAEAADRAHRIDLALDARFSGSVQA